jgi:protein-disulfide isomerase
MTDHVRGTGPIELTMFGDFECPYCRDAQPALARVMQRLDGRIRLRFKHFPIADRHPHAIHAARAAEAAARQDRFWEMHDALYAHQGSLEDADLAGYASSLGLDMDRFAADLASSEGADAVTADHDEGLTLQLTGTPAFLIDGEKHHGFYDVEGLIDALEDAGA